MNNRNILQFRDVSFSYAHDSKKVLSHLNLDVHKGEFVSLIGPSGCGKSTLFRLITGLEKPETGAVFIQGKEITGRSNEVGYMPQQDLLLPWRTVLENAALAMECQGIKKKDAYEKVKALLDKFGLQGYDMKYPKDLSGGMRQRVSFLRTFLTGADIFLLDEPFSALDAITKLNMQEWLLEQWQKWEKTVLFITHDVEEALFLSNRILVMTEQPVTNLIEVTVPLGKNRTRQDLSRSEVLQIKEALIDMLKGKVTV
ncbi:ABC transporter ATP-binding protein [Microbacteriaceae bacterium 4G12]